MAFLKLIHFQRFSKAIAFLCVFACLSFSIDIDDGYLMSKSNKVISKMFGNGVLMNRVQIEDSGSPQLQHFIPANSYFEVIQDSAVIGYASLRRAKGCKIGGCSLNKETHGKDGEAYEHFDYLCVFSADGLIMNVSVLRYGSDYGYEICGKRWLKQFVGSDGFGLEYEDTIDAISGATTSAFSITYDIGVQMDILRNAGVFSMLR